MPDFEALSSRDIDAIIAFFTHMAQRR